MSWSMGVLESRGEEAAEAFARMVEVCVEVDEEILLPFAITTARTDSGASRGTVPPNAAMRMMVRIRDCDLPTCVSPFPFTMMPSVQRRSHVPLCCCFQRIRAICGGDAGR